MSPQRLVYRRSVGFLAGSAMAQTSRGTGAETATTGSTNPGASVGTPGSHAIRPSGIDPTNSKAIEASQNGWERAGDPAQK
jgi:hypothetical protein